MAKIENEARQPSQKKFSDHNDAFPVMPATLEAMWQFVVIRSSDSRLNGRWNFSPLLNVTEKSHKMEEILKLERLKLPSKCFTFDYKRLIIAKLLTDALVNFSKACIGIQILISMACKVANFLCVFLLLILLNYSMFRIAILTLIFLR